MPQNTGSLARLMIPALRAVIMQVYNEHAKIYSQIFHEFTSQKQFEEFLSISGYGVFQDKNEGGGISYVTQKQGFETRLVPKAKGLGIIITMEEMQDNLYAKVGADRVRLLRFSHLQTLEYDAHFLLNNAFSNTVTYADGRPLIDSAHPLIGAQGGTASNILATGAPISEASMEDLCIQIGLAVNEDGFKSVFPKKNLIVQTNQQYNAKRLYKTMSQPGTANNDVNALSVSGDLPPLIVSPYLENANPWFITIKLPNPEQGLVLVNRMPLDLERDNSIDTRDLKLNMVCRYAFGAADSRNCIYGSNAL